MKKEDVFLLNQLLADMKKLSDILNEYYLKQDFEGVLKAKSKILETQKKIGEII